MKQEKKSAFVITEFTNSSGEIVYRVSGWLDGKRVRIAHRRGSAKTLSAEQCRELMAFLEAHEGGRLVPRFFNVFGPRQDPRSVYAAAVPIFMQQLSLLPGP